MAESSPVPNPLRLTDEQYDARIETEVLEAIQVGLEEYRDMIAEREGEEEELFTEIQLDLSRVMVEGNKIVMVRKDGRFDMFRFHVERV